jgi:parvulin-like peptidyl-prolyl isomerase
MTIKQRSFNDQNKQGIDDPKFVKVKPNAKEEKYVKNALRSKNTYSLLTHSEYQYQYDDTIDWN